MLPVALGLASGAFAQSGEIDGVVKDAQGLVLPGVTVTLTGEAVIGSQTAVTLADGTYRFRALRPASYNVSYELAGFQTLNREGIIVSGLRTITVDVTLDVATVAETITVTGESPVVDVKNTSLSNEFTVEELQDVPSATDVWAVLSQTPGVRMRGYDVGGSHKSQQTGYESFGIRNQNRVLSDGVDSTEGTGGTGFYYDYYSAEEFTTSAAGSDVEMTTPGSLVMMTIKSGGNEFSGLYHADYEGENMVSDNLDDETAARGYTGNPNLIFYELHADLGGPIVKDKAWFYGFFNKFRIDKAISGVDQNVATDIGNFYGYGAKLSFQVTQKDQVVAYGQQGLKQKPNRGLSAVIEPDAVLAQDSWSWVYKAEWQRVWNDRTFSNFQLKHFGFGWPMVPKVDPDTDPPRFDSSNSGQSGAGWNVGLAAGPPFTFDRWKPQVTATMNYYIPNKAGSHDWKFGFDWMIDSSQYGFNSNSGSVRYLDNSNLGRPFGVNEIRFYNVKADGANQNDNRDKHTAFFVQDTWAPNERLTLNLGFRFENQKAYYLSSELQPERTQFFPTGTIEGRDLVTWNTWAPRLGVTYDLMGTGKTVLKGHYGRYYTNIADRLSAANPAGLAFVTYQFLDQNQNGLYDGDSELGNRVGQSGTVGSSLANAQGTPVNPDMAASYADEFSASVEHELMPDTSLRFSYVRKQFRNDYGNWNSAQVIPLLENPVPYITTCNGCPGSFAGATLNLVRVPDAAANAQSPGFDTFPGGYDSDNWDTFQISFQRRFSEDFFVQTSYDYQLRDERRRASAVNTSPLVADPLQGGGQNNFWQNHNPSVDNFQDNSNWNFRLLGRYVLPKEIAFSANLRVQSGWPWAPIYPVAVPGSGTVNVFLEDIDNNYSETVSIFDIRVEKIFSFGGRYKVTGMLDVYNVFNSNADTNFTITTGRSFNNIIAALDPRAIKIGARFQF
jgi:hypothetical protein